MGVCWIRENWRCISSAPLLSLVPRYRLPLRLVRCTALVRMTTNIQQRIYGFGRTNTGEISPVLHIAPILKFYPILEARSIQSKNKPEP